MRNAPIVEEIRREREAYAAKFNYDLEAIYQDIKRQELESGHETVTLPSKRPAVEAEEEQVQTAPAASSMKTQREVSETEIFEIAGRYLKDKHPGGATLEALTQGVRHEQGWWYVPVRPSFEPPRRYEYYEALADVEGALEDEENLTVLFLPTAPEIV